MNKGIEIKSEKTNVSGVNIASSDLWENRKGFSWDMNDSQIARLFGVSRQAVGSARRRHCAKESLFKWEQSGGARAKILKAYRENDLKDLTASEVAMLVGCSVGRARSILCEEKLPYMKVKFIRPSKIKWPSITDLGSWSLSNKELASLLGTSVAYVALYRWRKGVPLSREIRGCMEASADHTRNLIR